MKALGLVGGLGVGATAHVYKALSDACAARRFCPSLFIAHADVDRVLALVAVGRSPELADYLAGLIAKLAAAGATIAAIPALTPHVCVRELVERSPLPIVSMLDLTANEVRQRGLNQVAIFGTRIVQETRLFGTLAADEVIQPPPERRLSIHDAYVSIVRAGQAGLAEANTLRACARAAIELDGAEAIVLAGTELALVFGHGDPGFPSVDCTRLLVEALVDHAEPDRG